MPAHACRPGWRCYDPDLCFPIPTRRERAEAVIAVVLIWFVSLAFWPVFRFLSFCEITRYLSEWPLAAPVGPERDRLREYVDAVARKPWPVRVWHARFGCLAPREKARWRAAAGVSTTTLAAADCREAA